MFGPDITTLLFHKIKNWKTFNFPSRDLRSHNYKMASDLNPQTIL